MNRSNRNHVLAGLSCLALFVASAHGATRYVTTTGAGVADCGDWANACTLATGLAGAASGDEVWVAAGTYSGTISLVNGVKIIGGFAGTETAASQSNPVANQTVLDGDGDGPVVTSLNHASSTMLRGFRITDGHDDSALGGSQTGGGGAFLGNSSAMFVQCTFDGNSSATWGGAVAIKGTGSAEFVNCKFTGNGAVDFGSGTVSPYAGGAVYIVKASPRFTNCLFSNNTGQEAGGIAVQSGTPVFVNCTFVDNQSTVGSGGALYDPLGGAAIKNSILWDNTAIRGNPEVQCYRGRFTEVTKTDIAGGHTGTGNIDADPLFGQGHKLLQTSPCKNAGQTSALPPDVADLDWDGNTTEKVPFDLNGDPRKVEFVVDMGAFETPFNQGGQ